MKMLHIFDILLVTMKKLSLPDLLCYFNRKLSSSEPQRQREQTQKSTPFAATYGCAMAAALFKSRGPSFGARGRTGIKTYRTSGPRSRRNCPRF